MEPKEESPRNPKSRRASARAPLPEKLVFGQFGRVRLTQEEYDRLIAEHGERGHQAIAKLDAWLEAKGDRYKSHYAAMHSWVLRAVGEDETRRARAAPAAGGTPAPYGSRTAYVSPAQKRLDANRAAMEEFIRRAPDAGAAHEG